MAETSGKRLREWLLLSLWDLGGEGRRAEVHQRVEDRFGDEFTAEDRAPRVGRPANEPAWRNNIDSLYDRLKKSGVLLLAQRGEPWRLSPSGQAEATALPWFPKHAAARSAAEMRASAGQFSPKNSTPYQVQIEAREQTKSRNHESLLKDYGTAMMCDGWTAITNVHPRDMELIRADRVWLVEVKMVYHNDVSGATRAALGQLIEYRHFFYDSNDPPGLLGLFSEPLEPAYVCILSSVGIASVWRSGAGWAGSPQADAAGLVPEAR